MNANDPGGQPQNAAVAFFREMVEPTVAEFMATPDDRRRGCLACLVLSSLADHYFHAIEVPKLGAMTDKMLRSAVADFRKRAATDNWSVSQVHDVANATKHFTKLDGRVALQDMEADEIGECGASVCGWPINGRYVVIETAPGDTWLLHELVQEAVSYWRFRLFGLASGKWRGPDDARGPS